MKALVNAVLDRGVFEYSFRPAEIIWAVAQGVGAFILATQVAPVTYTDWQSWVIALGGALYRPVLAAIFGKQPTGGTQ